MLTPMEMRASSLKATSLGIGDHVYIARHGEYFTDKSVRAKLIDLFGRQPTHSERRRWMQLRRLLGGVDPTPIEYHKFQDGLLVRWKKQ